VYRICAPVAVIGYQDWQRRLASVPLASGLDVTGRNGLQSLVVKVGGSNPLAHTNSKFSRSPGLALSRHIAGDTRRAISLGILHGFLATS
jgi:hypothetical protein